MFCLTHFGKTLFRSHGNTTQPATQTTSSKTSKEQQHIITFFLFYPSLFYGLKYNLIMKNAGRNKS